MPKEDWGFLNEKAFEAALQASVPERLPDKVAAVTPWKRAMGRGLAGMALTGTNLWGLNYPLPGIGLVLMLLGFRLLRREAQWFRCCFLLTGMQLAYCVFQLILQATPYQAAYAASTVGLVLPYLNALLQLAQGFACGGDCWRCSCWTWAFRTMCFRLLRREEIKACRGVIQVVVSVQEFDQEGGFCRSSGSNPLCITGAGGKLTREPAGWMIFHHFLWNTAPPFHGTAAIQL